MDLITVILALIFLILAWKCILEPILDGLGGLGQNLVKKLQEPDPHPTVPEPGFCPCCGGRRAPRGSFCPHCGADLSDFTKKE